MRKLVINWFGWFGSGARRMILSIDSTTYDRLLIYVVVPVGFVDAATQIVR